MLAHTLTINAPSPEVKLNWPVAERYKTELWVKRDDLLHPIISGNKWRKLKYALLDAQQRKVKHIISFGGGYSNHLHALGYCCHQLDIKFTALVRGNYTCNPTPMLRDLSSWQVDIQYLSKVEFKQRTQPEFIQQLQQRYSNALIIPEGGTQQQALQGVGEIVSELHQTYDYIVAPVASGGTLAGLIASTPNTSQVLGVAVLKGEGYLEGLVQNLLPKPYKNWHIEHTWHGGGYAKTPSALTQFCRQFSAETAISVEPVYSGKLFYALAHLLQQGFFATGSKILALHTGGLQGSRTQQACE